MNNQLVVGSLAAISQSTGQSLAESFLSASVILILDCSGSMQIHDAPDGESREQVAREQLIRLQASHKGKIALICFADFATFSPSGLPVNCGSMTNMVAALCYVLPADDTGTKFILISDGSPNDEKETLRVAKEFKTSISTIYIGPEDDNNGGRAFLEKLASLTGGKSETSDAPGLLENQVEKLLLLT